MRLIVILIFILGYQLVYPGNLFEDYYKNVDTGDIKFVENEQINRISRQFYASNGIQAAFYDKNIYYFTGLTDREPENGFGIYSLNRDLVIKCEKKIGYGRGPEEALWATGLYKIKNRFYIFDFKLYRFLVYDEMFNYIDVINFNQKIMINGFFQNNEDLYAFVSNEEGVQFFEVDLLDEVHFIKKKFCKV